MTGGVVYLDTNVFIDALEGVPDVALPAQALPTAIRDNARSAVTSELTIAETIVPKLHAGKRRSYLEPLVWSNVVRLVPISRSILFDTARLAAVTTMKLPDRIHVATAVRESASAFVTRDEAIKVPKGMLRVNTTAPSALELVSRAP